jgi:protein gp37
MFETSISYLDWHVPLVTGCQPCSPACVNCWAAKLAATRLKHHPFYEGLAYRDVDDGGYFWTGEVRYHPELLDRVTDRQRPRAIGIAFSGDLLHDAMKDTDIIPRLRWTARHYPQHSFIFTTKRPQNLERLGVDLPPNLWVGVSCWDQASLDEAMGYLAEVNGNTWISLEPLLGPVDFGERLWRPNMERLAAAVAGRPFSHVQNPSPRISGVILGCESGPNRRHTEDHWFRSLRNECMVARVPFYLKQMEIEGKVDVEPFLDGRQHLELPWDTAKGA